MFANSLFQTNRFEFSAPRYYDFVSHSKNTKTRAKKDAKTAEMYFESEKPRGTTRDDVPNTPREKHQGKGEFYSDFKRKRDVGCTLSFFLSFFRFCVRPAQRREVFQMFLVFSLSFSLFFSLSLSL